MIGPIDLYTTVIIENGFRSLAKDPERLFDVLVGFGHRQEVMDKVGRQYIKNCMDLVLNEEVHVEPYYQLDMQRIPCVAVIASGDEDQLYIGDYGSQEAPQNLPAGISPALVSKPTIIAEFSASSVDGKKLFLPSGSGIEDQLWRGLYIKNGDFISRIDAVSPESKFICLEDEIPDGTAQSGWVAQTSTSTKLYERNASTDRVNIQCKLTTSGEPSVHRLFGVVLRYILKSRRLVFDSFGIQNLSISYSPMVVVDDKQGLYESVYTMSGVYTDSWVAKITQTTPAGLNLGVTYDAVRSEQ